MTGERTLPLDDLERRISVTARCRFIASERLGKRDQRISWIVAIASTYAIILTVIPYFIRFPAEVSSVLNLATVGLSIVTLVASLVIGSRHDAVNSEQHHRSALELNEVVREIALAYLNANNASPAADIVEKIQHKYNNILQKYSVNHAPEDYAKLQLLRPEDYPWNTLIDRWLIRFKLLFLTNLAYVVMLLLSISVGWLVFIYAMPRHLLPVSI